MTRNPRAAAVWLVIGIIVGGLAGGLVAWFAAGDRAPAPAKSPLHLPEAEDVIDEPLMIALAQAKNFHHKAQVYMTDGNIAEAVAQLEAILAITFPPGAPEGDDIRLDARAMLAKLLVAQGKIDEAMTVVDQGIGGARRDSFFLANLYTVKGEVHQARASQLDDQGPAAKPRADAEKRAAIDAFDRSIKINVALQERLVQDRKRQRSDGE